MAEVVNSLFGITPESLQAQRDAALQTQALQYAQLDPFQRATASIYAGANKLGGAIGGMLGAQDPELARVTQRQSLMQQVAPTNAEGWGKLASELVQKGDVAGAQEAFAKAQALKKAAMDAEKAQSEIEKNKAEAAKALRIPAPTDTRTPEEKNAAAYALTKGKVGSDKYNEAFADKLAELITKEGAKPTKVGVALDGSQRPVYSDGQTQFIFVNDKDNKIVKQPYVGGVSQLTSSTVNKPVDVAAIIKQIGTEQDVKDKATTWKAAGDAYKLQVPMVEKLKEVKDSLPKTFTGSFSDITLQFGKGLSALGVPVDRTKLSNTEYMNGVSAQVLQTIARNFPGSLAVKEMDQLVKSKFNSQQQIETITRVLTDLQTEIEAGTKSYEQLAKLPENARYTKDLNLLTGQTFSKLKRYRALENKAKSLAPGQKMTAAEVKEAETLQAELGE